MTNPHLPKEVEMHKDIQKYVSGENVKEKYGNKYIIKLNGKMNINNE